MAKGDYQHSAGAGLASAKDRAKNPTEKYVRAGIEYKPSDKEARASAELHKRWDPTSRDANHYQYHRTWWMDVAYYAGLQWVNWNEAYNQLSERKTPPWRRLYQANMIMPMVMRNFSKLLADNVTSRVSPITTDREDVKASKLAEKAIHHGMYVSGWDEAEEAAVLWSLVCGTGFIKLTWNPSAGPEIEGEDGKIKHMGEMEADACSPFSVRVPNGAVDHKHLPWMVQVTRRSMEYIYARYPDKADYVTPDSSSGRENFLEDRVSSIVGIGGVSSNTDTENEPNSVNVVEMWTLPCKGYPKGLHVIEANGVVLHAQDENPYVSMGIGLPYIPYQYTKIPGRYWGMGLVEQLIFPQKEYNVSRSQVIENQNLMSRPKWLVPRGHGLPRVAITSEPGEIIEYNPALPKPEQVGVAPLPNYVLDHQQRCINEMQDIGGQHDVTQAKAPASVRSGLAINLLQQQDVAVIGMPLINLRRARQMGYSFMLKMMKDRYNDLRVLQFVGRESSYDLDHFKGTDLKGHTSVRIVPEVSIMETPEGRKQALLDFVELGILQPGNPDEKMEILKGLQFDGLDQIVQEKMLDEKNAELENELFNRPMERGGPVITEPKEWEDHGVHIQRHNLFRKSAEYRAMSEQQRTDCDTHVAMHQEFVMFQMMQQQEQMMASRGSPGDKGQASQPGRGGGQGGGGNGEASEGGGGPEGGGGGEQG